MEQDTLAERGTFTYKAAIAMIALLFVLFPLVLGGSIYRDWTETRRRAEDRATAASQVVATSSRWITELARQALSRVDEGLGANPEANAAGVVGLVSETIANLPGNVKIFVIGPDGRTLFSTDPRVSSVDLRDREYFGAVAAGAQWYVSPLLISRVDNQQKFVFSKRMERGGQFAGVIVISLDVALLKEMWESLEFDEVSIVGLFRTDGELVARYPLADGPLNISKTELFTALLPEHDVGTYSAQSAVDGIERIVGYRKVPQTDFIAVASISMNTAFALFWRATFMTLAFAVPTAILLGGAILWIFRLLAFDQKNRKQLFETLKLNRLLVRDTHHRVKNNLQAIMSLVRMHPLPDELKSDLQHRIAAMSAVHEHLYRLDQYTEVDAVTLIPGIIDPLVAGYAQTVNVEYDIDPLVVDHDHATPLALLVSELVTNSLKYAFPGDEHGTIHIGLKRLRPGKARLIVSDDGVGFEASQMHQGLGSRLIKAMLLQLDGTSTVGAGQGTSFEAELSIGKATGPTDTARMRSVLKVA